VFEEEKIYNKGEGQLNHSNVGSGYLALSEFPQSIILPAIEEETTNLNRRSPDRQTVNELLEFVGRVKGQKNARNIKANTFTPNQDSSPVHPGLALIESKYNLPVLSETGLNVLTPIELDLSAKNGNLNFFSNKKLSL